MAQTTLAYFAASLLFAIALIALLGGRAVARRLGAAGARLRAADERLVAGTPLLDERFAARRASLASLSARTERTLWSMARFDDRLEATRATLVARHAELDRGRARLIAARATVARLKRTARTLIRVIELRRAILG